MPPRFLMDSRNPRGDTAKRLQRGSQPGRLSLGKKQCLGKAIGEILRHVTGQLRGQ